jgi:hypothetical protein
MVMPLYKKLKVTVSGSSHVRYDDIFANSPKPITNHTVPVRLLLVIAVGATGVVVVKSVSKRPVEALYKCTEYFHWMLYAVGVAAE